MPIDAYRKHDYVSAAAQLKLEVSEEMARGIPEARIEVIEHHGHVSSIEQPAAVTSLLRAWTSRASG